MKRILLIFVLFLCFNNLNLVAEENIFIWGEVNIFVPLGKDLQDVLSEIKENIKLKEGYFDPDFYVENNYINYTTQSSINTNYLKTYRLDHRATSPKYNKKEIKTFYLHVVDITPPVVVSSVSFKLAYGEKEPDYLKGLVVVDNYTNKNDIEIIVDKSNINYNLIGIYEILYIISDSSGNKTYHTETVEIVDLIKPVITKIKETIVPVFSEFLIEDYFLITDNYDKNPTISFTLTGDINILGQKEIKITAIDQSGNEAVFLDSLEVVDLMPPEINLKEEVISVNIFEEFDLYEIISVSDNYDEVSIKDLIITHNINFNEVGSYSVILEITDSSNNYKKRTLRVLVRDLIPPVIMAEDLEIKTGDVINFLNYVTVTDNISIRENIDLTIVYNDVNFQKPGIYHVIYEAVDEYGNPATKTIEVRVLGLKEEHKTFYYIVIFAVLVLVVGITIIVIKKRKKLY